MSRLFGWDLPPGVTTAMLNPDEGLCEMCLNPADDCSCQECSICGVSGDPMCYEDHGLHQSKDQKAGRQGRTTLIFINELVDQQNEIAAIYELGDDPCTRFEPGSLCGCHRCAARADRGEF